jgi:predicted nuclease of restriction endonuclease-like (RecB) superfamily
MSVARSVNTAQVMANWMVGREIVEEEQQGRERAGYAERIVALLSERLSADYGTGYSAQNLAYMKQFYLAYPDLLPEALIRESGIFHALRGKSSKPRQNVLRTTRSSIQKANLQIAAESRGEPENRVWNIFHAVRGKSEAWGLPVHKPGQLHPGLSWTHYRTLLRVGTQPARAFYEIEAVRQAWSARELERQINSLLFERLAVSRDKKGLIKLASEGHRVALPMDVFKDPVVIEFLGLPESPRLVESTLEQALIDNLRTFLLELGKGFAFVSRQERITLDGDHFYIDLVFYHAILKCFVLIDLKVGKLTHNDLGQMQFYVNYFDRERRTEGDNPTLGLILSSHKNDAVVRYTLGEPRTRKIFASRYQLYLPTEEELQSQIQRGVRLLAPAALKAASNRSAKPNKRAGPEKQVRPGRRAGR